MNTKEIPAPKEFPPDFTIPQCILDLGLRDQSWHNDSCPSFLMYESGNAEDGSYEYVDLWVDHPDPAQREFPEWPRFRICVEIWTKSYCIVDTDSLEEVMSRIEAMKTSLAAIRNLEFRFGEWHYDDDPTEILWSGKIPSEDDMRDMREAIEACNTAWKIKDYNAINAGVWVASNWEQ